MITPLHVGDQGVDDLLCNQLLSGKYTRVVVCHLAADINKYRRGYGRVGMVID